MSGRFFSLPFVGALSLLAVLRVSTRVAGVLGVATLTLGLAMPCSPLRSTANYGTYDPRGTTNDHGVADERAFYYPWTGLLNAKLEMTQTLPPMGLRGRISTPERKGRHRTWEYWLSGLFRWAECLYC